MFHLQLRLPYTSSFLQNYILSDWAPSRYYISLYKWSLYHIYIYLRQHCKHNLWNSRKNGTTVKDRQVLRKKICFHYGGDGIHGQSVSGKAAPILSGCWEDLHLAATCKRKRCFVSLTWAHRELRKYFLNKKSNQYLKEINIYFLRCLML